MSVICINDCPTTPTNITPYQQCEPYRRKEGIRRFILIRCTLQLTDILDPVNLQAAKDRGEIVFSPPGRVVINTPTTETFEFDDCGKLETGESTYNIDFETHEAAENLEDYDFFKSLYDSRNQWYVMFEHCAGFYYFDDEWVEAVKAGAPATVAGSNPGFEFSITSPPNPTKGDGGFTRWGFQMQIIRNGAFCAEFLPSLDAVV